jgi:hypothetical protein
MTTPGEEVTRNRIDETLRHAIDLAWDAIETNAVTLRDAEVEQLVSSGHDALVRARAIVLPEDEEIDPAPYAVHRGVART